MFGNRSKSKPADAEQADKINVIIFTGRSGVRTQLSASELREMEFCVTEQHSQYHRSESRRPFYFSSDEGVITLFPAKIDMIRRLQSLTGWSGPRGEYIGRVYKD